MQTILIVGAGKSSGALIEYLSNHAITDNFLLSVADINDDTLARIRSAYANLDVIPIKTLEDEALTHAIRNSTLVISMLPAQMHIHIAQKCLSEKKHLITPSYISPDMQALHRQVNDAGLLFLNEMGLDPGIDHMSACEWIDHVHAQGGQIIHFKSHCGGLVAKESNDNPWGYKFSWNPHNVVLAGQGNGFIRWRENNTIKYLPYHRLFASATTVVYKGEAFESYPNRDSLVYIEPYKLQNAETVYRGTLRYKGFCNAWHQLVYLGLCDNTTLIDINENETYASFILKFLQAENKYDIGKKLAEALQISSESDAFKKLKWLGLLENKKIPLTGQHTAAQVLQTILEEKWKLKPGDKDRVVMIHEFTYRLHEKLLATTAVLDITGTEQHTAMATTVGLPIGIAARMIIHKTISLKGVIRPVYSEIYSPVLKQLSQCGINFNIQTVGL